MTKIYVHLTENGNIFESSDQAQTGWTEVENDPAFNIENMMEWTVRESDGLLVHISTGLTPDEETKESLTNLTKERLNDSLTKTQLQMALTTLTKEYIEDKANSNLVTNELTRQIAELTIKLDKVMGIDPTPETPTDVTSTATTDGAVITAQ